MSLTKLAKELSQESLDFGFDNDVPTSIALIHSEVSEAFEAFRNEKYADLTQFVKDSKDWSSHEEDFPGIFKATIKDSFEDELADSLIRLLVLCGQKGVDIDSHVSMKRKFNKTRGKKWNRF